MSDKNIDFPQYRKLTNGLRLYKINSNNSFEELQMMGEKVFHFTIVAHQYPEKLRIMDMLNLTEGFDLLSKTEWDQPFNKLSK
ncbi:MAG: hypothetical protein WC044_03035 [Crocinitomicaceae bacterium]